MGFSELFVDKVRQSTDIVQVVQERGVILKRFGSSYKGLCPFHGEKSPSFNVNPDKGFFHCFGCGVGGDAIRFVMDYDRLNFPEAVEALAKDAGIPLEQDNKHRARKSQESEPGLQCLKLAAQFYHECLHKPQHGTVARAYLQKRGVPESMWHHFLVGYAPEGWQTLGPHWQKHGLAPELLLKTGLCKLPDPNKRAYDTFRHRLMFPIRDRNGRVIGFGGRALEADQEPKYLNSPDNEYYHKSQVLYGYHEGLESIRQQRRMIFVEGYLDVIRMHQFGFRETVATCGTALTEEHVKLVKRSVDRAILLFDGDKAGRAAALKASQLFLNVAMDVQILTLPEGEDPDTLLLGQGREAMDQLFEKGVSHIEFFTLQTLNRHDRSALGRKKALDELLPPVCGIPDPVLRNTCLAQIAEITGIPTEALFGAQKKTRQNLRKQEISDKVLDCVVLQETPEHLDEKWILQALLTNRQLIEQVKEYLYYQDLACEDTRALYDDLMQLDPKEFASLNIEQLCELFPERSALIKELYVQDFPSQALEQHLKLYVHRIKSRNIRRDYQERVAWASEEEKLRLRVEFRQKETQLAHLFQR